VIAVPLADIVSPASKKAGAETGLPVYSVTKHAGFVRSLEYFKKQVFSRNVAGYKLVERGDFAYATIHLDEGSIGIAPERGLISPMYTVFKADDARVDPRYLIRFLKSPAALAQYPQLGKGAVHRRKAISLAALGTLTVPLPTLAEQRRIAAILDHADALRAKRRQVLTHIDGLGSAAFVERFGSHAELLPLGESLTFVTSGGRGWAKYYSDEGARFIQSLDVQMGSISARDPVFVVPPDNAEARRTRTIVGDVLLTITGSRIGRVAALPASLAGSFVSQHVAILRPNPQEILPEFLAAMLALPSLGQRLIAGAQYGQTKPGLNFEQIRGFSLPRPPLPEQRRFVDQLHGIAGQRAAMTHAETRMAELVACLQSRAFRGEL